MAASARIDELRSKFDDNPRRYFASLANEYRKAGDLGTAIAICRAQLRSYPTHMSGHVVLGQALYESGELDAARVAFERAVELDPENLIALRHLGDTAMARHERETARRWYRRVLDIDPTNETIASLVQWLDGPPVEEIRARYTEVFPTPPQSSPAEPPPIQPTSLVDEAIGVEPVAPRHQTPAEPLDAIVDLSPDDLAWPAPVSADEEATTSELTFVESMTPVESGGEHASEPASDQSDSFEFVDGWGALDLSDPAETAEVPVVGLDVPVVGLDVTPADDAGLRELSHVDDVADEPEIAPSDLLDFDEPVVARAEEVAEDLVEAPHETIIEPPVVDAVAAIIEPSVEESGPANDEPVLAIEPLAQEPIDEPVVVPTLPAEPPPLRIPQGETAPLDEVIASGAFVTETMAELCIQQGHDDEALEIYEQLVAQRPNDARLAERRDALRARLVGPVAGGETAGDFLRRLAEARPTPIVSAPAVEAPAAVGAEPVHEPSAEPVAAPVHVGASERDLWAAEAWRNAFRPDAAPTESLLASIPARAEAAPQDFSFDRFFVGIEELPPEAEASAATPEPVAAEEPDVEPETEPAAESATDDLDEFNAWLRGLRDA